MAEIDFNVAYNRPSPIAGLSQGIQKGMDYGMALRQLREQEQQNKFKNVIKALDLMGKMPESARQGTYQSVVLPAAKAAKIDLPTEYKEEYSPLFDDASKIVQQLGSKKIDEKTARFGLAQIQLQFNKYGNKAGASAISDLMDKSLGGAEMPKENKAPAGFRWTATGELEAIPGGPADIKGRQQAMKDESLIQGQIKQADTIINKANQALGLVSPTTAGFGGSLTSKIPGTPAKDLKTIITTIKANLGFQQLQNMRASSPTGGALGQVSNIELDLLTSAVENLDPEQSPGQLKDSLKEISNRYSNWKATLEGKNPYEGKNRPVPKVKSGDVLKGYRFKGGDPAKKENWEKIK